MALLGGLPLEKLRALLLTHFHSDHIAAVGDFNLASWVAGRPRPLEILGPVGIERVVSGLNEMYALDGAYRVEHHGAGFLPPELHELVARTIEPGVVLDDGGLIITAFVVDHSPVKPAVGYRFEYGGRSVVITGDTIVTDGLIEAARGADLLLADAISLPIVEALEHGARAAGRDRPAKILHDIQEYHASTSSLADAAQRADVHKLALYHLVPAPWNVLMKKIFLRGMPDTTVLTEDRMIFDLPAGGSEVLVR
ncbi:MAG: MBL fold metallo-hydrolase [Polyangiales bacterium]